MILLLFLSSLVANVHSAFSITGNDSSVFSFLLQVVFSRGIYPVLAVIIIVGFLFSFFNNEKNAKESMSRRGQLELISSKNACLPSYKKDLYNPNSVNDLLGEAENTAKSLMKEMEHLEAVRLSLEERSGKLEREKQEAEERLKEARLSLALQVEDLRKEMAVTRRELQLAEGERDALQREVDSASRESRVADLALRDQALLAEQLEAARGQLALLRSTTDLLRRERDAALNILKDFGCEEDILAEVLGGSHDMESASSGSRKDEPQVSKELNNDCVCDSVGIDMECTFCTEKELQEEMKPSIEFKPGALTESPAFRNFLISSTPEED